MSVCMAFFDQSDMKKERIYGIFVEKGHDICKS